ncbi:MAG: hypothetical protein NZ578_00980 [Candidatus Binatia bacterium]|nr:hypothetical protein [Candidatus Binatia bacterium]
MRIRFKTEGGIAHFPGLSQPVTIDCDQLPTQEAREVEQLVADARFFALPAGAGAGRQGAADYRHYTITVEAEGRRHTVQVSDPVADPALQRLVAYLQAKARALRRVRSPE